ncbi:hypothetical protein HJFPF1_05052 [Paramyrothecium foliicola]|nr:hypothetical protein HJFPF1_05052 [Paramyrothecium foliicola]
MLSRVATKPRLCWACRQSLHNRLGAVRGVPIFQPQLRRPYSSEQGSAIRDALKALIIDKDVPEHETGSRRGATQDDAFKTALKAQGRTGFEKVQDREPGTPSQNSDDTSSLPLLEEPKETGYNIALDADEDSVYDFNKDHFSHELLHHKKLEVDALGQPVEALIIKNPNKTKRARKAIRALEDQPMEGEIQWDNLVQKKDSESDYSDIVWQNLQELRPRKRVIPQDEFSQIMTTLVEGFKKDQLLHYYNFESSNEPASKVLGERPWLRKRGEWVAETPHEWGRLSPKQSHALAIMVKRWGLEIKEHVESFGRVQIWLQPNVFDVLTRLNTNILERLGSEVLDRSDGEKITANPQEARLSIYTRKTTVPTFLGQLDENLQALRTRRVTVAQVAPEALEPAAMAELARVTNTFIVHDAATKELEVTWLAEEQADSSAPEGHLKTEDAANVVSRLLLAVQRKNTLPSTAEIFTPLNGARSPAGMLERYDREKRSMSWKDKLGSWSRYVFRIGRADENEQNGLELPEQLLGPTSAFDSTEAGVENFLTATFGHVLHASQDVSQVTQGKSNRVLAPMVPHPAALTSITNGSDAQVTQTTAIMLNFSPAVSTENGTWEGAPEVRLRLPIDHDTDLANFSFPPNSALYGSVPCTIKDVLLPSEAVDVRVSHYQQLALDTEQQHLKAFLASSEFNLLAGRLRTPSQTKFSIPTRWLPAKSVESDGVADVPYVFMGLEVHQTVDLDLVGHVLRYNSIEAGQHGGQRQELSLQATTTGASSDMLRKNFAQLVSEVVQGKKFSWHEGFKLASERSQEDFEIELVDEDAEDIAEGADVLEELGEANVSVQRAMGTAVPSQAQHGDDASAVNFQEPTSSEDLVDNQDGAGILSKDKSPEVSLGSQGAPEPSQDEVPQKETSHSQAATSTSQTETSNEAKK